MRQLMVAAAALMIGASVAQAQGPEALREGRTSIAFAIPQSGSTTFGIWKQLSPTRALGLEASALYARRDRKQPDSESTEFVVSVTPAMKWYRSLSSTVAPYIRASAGVGYSSTKHEQSGNTVDESDGFSVSAGGGIGVDWFPLRSISIGGFTGLNAGYGRTESNNLDENSFFLRTGTSALTMHIYF